jgi:hypothetical protein
MPSFGQRWFAVSLSRTDSDAVGHVAVLDRRSGGITSRAFHIEGRSFDEMMKRWDAQTDGYWGEFELVYDGKPLGFERKRKWYVTSGIGQCQ